MSKDKDAPTDKGEHAPKQDEGASREADKATESEEELEEGLEESMPGSDAPASTRRSSSD